MQLEEEIWLIVFQCSIFLETIVTNQKLRGSIETTGHGVFPAYANTLWSLQKKSYDDKKTAICKVVINFWIFKLFLKTIVRVLKL